MSFNNHTFEEAANPTIQPNTHPVSGDIVQMDQSEVARGSEMDLDTADDGVDGEALPAVAEPVGSISVFSDPKIQKPKMDEVARALENKNIKSLASASRPKSSTPSISGTKRARDFSEKQEAKFDIDWLIKTKHPIEYQQNNPKTKPRIVRRGDPGCFDRYEMYKTATTLNEAIVLGASKFDLRWDMWRDFWWPVQLPTLPEADASESGGQGAVREGLEQALEDLEVPEHVHWHLNPNPTPKSGRTGVTWNKGASAWQVKILTAPGVKTHHKSRKAWNMADAVEYMDACTEDGTNQGTAKFIDTLGKEELPGAMDTKEEIKQDAVSTHSSADIREVEKMLTGLLEGKSGWAAKDTLLDLFQSQQEEIQHLTAANKQSKRKTHEELVTECNENGKTMSTKTYRDRVFPPLRPDQEVCHIYAEANGGACHPSNYVPGDGGLNRTCQNNNDGYYAALVGPARTTEAYNANNALSPKKTLIKPDILYELGRDHVRQSTKVFARDVHWRRYKDEKKSESSGSDSSDELSEDSDQEQQDN